MDFESAALKVKALYQGLGWPSYFTKIRFFTAPFRQLEPQVPRSGFIIDLGCGYGIFANLLSLMSPERKVLGLELDKFKVKYADRGIPGTEFRREDIVSANIPSVDCILLIHVLHHLNSYSEQETLINNCYKKLKPGGELIICEVDKYPWWKFFLAQLADHLLYPGDHIYYRFPDKLLSLLKDFKVQYMPSHQGTPFSHITFICEKS